MDELISVLVVIGIILKFVNKSDKAGKGKKGKKNAAVQTIASVEEMAEEVIGEAVRKAKSYRAKSGPAPVQPAAQPAISVAQPAMPAAAPAPQADWASHGHDEGASHADDTGCIGGSISHGMHEGAGRGSLGGEPLFGERTEGPGNIAALSVENEGARMTGPTERARLGAADLRKAMVISEILREPAALRGRTARR